MTYMLFVYYLLEGNIMKRIGLLALIMLSLAQASSAVEDYSKMSAEKLDSALIQAVEKGSADEVQKLVRAGANVNEEIYVTWTEGTGEGCWAGVTIYTLLQYAAIHGYIDIVHELIKAGAVIYADHPECSNFASAALIGASRGGHVDVVRALIKAGANVNHADRGDTALIGASEGGHADMVKELIKTGANVNYAGRGGSTALIGASRGGHVDVVRVLTKAGANVNHAGILGTALTEAAGKGHVDVVKELIKAGADINYADMEYMEYTALIEASIRGHADVVRELIKAGAHVNQAAHRKYEHHMGNTALIEAADRGYVDVVRELIKAGAHVNLTNKNGDTALMCAIKNHDFDVVQSILQSPEFHTGIWQRIKDSFSDSGTKSINYADKDGNTALILALNCFQYSYVEGCQKQYNNCLNSQNILEKLLQTPGINVHHVNKKGVTAIKLLEELQEKMNPLNNYR